MAADGNAWARQRLAAEPQEDEGEVQPRPEHHDAVIAGDYVRWTGFVKGQRVIRTYLLLEYTRAGQFKADRQGEIGLITVIGEGWQVLRCDCGKSKHKERCWQWL